MHQIGALKGDEQGKTQSWGLQHGEALSRNRAADKNQSKGGLLSGADSGSASKLISSPEQTDIFASLLRFTAGPHQVPFLMCLDPKKEAVLFLTPVTTYQSSPHLGAAC